MGSLVLIKMLQVIDINKFLMKLVLSFDRKDLNIEPNYCIIISEKIKKIITLF